MGGAYPVIFTATKDEKDTYLVYIPDIDGMTEGHGLFDAIKMARDYMGCTFFGIEDEKLPKPSEINNVDASKSVFFDDFPNSNSFVSAVDLDLDAYRKAMNQKAVRRNVSIPAWLDKKAEEAHINVSRVLQEALIEKLNV
ncbi:MAG: type II toxin-antitoxin system HicB family antitoxin [Lachnospiraceae bacterium]|nr:type II toxin-antitoxin system HicB family antitoxin [Lachnospiraceae bacterium]